jgi:ABC-type dipeptide/oligopeptide/nickel transport system permease component
MLGDEAPYESIHAMRQKLGLDQPLHIQYWRFVSGVFRGDLGRSIRTNRPVVGEIARVLPFTIQLATAAIILGTAFGIPLGVISATNRGSFIDLLASTLSIIVYSAPVFWLAILVLRYFSLQLDLFPMTGTGDPGNPVDVLYHLVLPGFTLGLRRIALLARMMRSSMLDVLHQDYVRTARAKGLAEKIVIYKHALKNAVIPVVTVIGLQLGSLLGGAVITETVFVRSGLGRLMVTAILKRDYPQVQGTLLVFAVVFLVLNLLVDLSYGFLDPRIKYS